MYSMHAGLLERKKIFLISLVVFGLITLACSTTLPTHLPDLPILPTLLKASPSVPNQVNTSTPETITTPELVVRIVPATIHLDSSNPGYKITAQKPQLIGTDETQTNSFNKLADKLIDTWIESFKADATNAPLDPSFTASELTITYAVEYQSTSIISILFVGGWYISGAVHAMQNYAVLNYDMVNDHALQFGDLFIPGADYLTRVSSLAKAALLAKNVLENEGGIAPLEQNFRNWTLHPDGLHLSFDPYQVGAYALGPQQIFIPYTQLVDILSPTGPASEFIK